MNRLVSRVLRAMGLAVVSVFAVAAGAQTATHLVISQVYGGGGGSSTSTTYTYNTDYVELFNPTNAAVSTSGLSVQYGSATSSTNYSSVFALPAATIQPGHYFLVAGSVGTAGGTLPTPDASAGSTLSMAATAGRVALVQGTTAVGCTATTIVDKVGYGAVTSGNCYEGSAAAPTLSSTTSATRTDACADSDNNGTDFTAMTPVAHTSASSSPSCFAGTTTVLAISSATANPSAVTQGGTTTLTVVVTPGSASTTETVTADLSQVGGSSTTSLNAAGNNTFTLSYTVPTSVPASSYSLPVTAIDQTNATANGTITLGVSQASSVTSIAMLQANRSTYVGTKVTTQGVVTLVVSGGWYMQVPGVTPAAGQGLYVYAGSGKVPSAVTAGMVVTVSGTLDEYPTTSSSHAPALELDSPSVSATTSGTVPAAITLPAGFPAAGAALTALQAYESMLVTFPSLTSTSGTGGSLTESTETESSNGYFYAVATGVSRPFREPGIDFRDFPYATCPTAASCASTATTTGVTRPPNGVIFDDDDERIYVASSLAPGTTALNVSAGAVIPDVTGVIDYTYASDSYYDPARFIPLQTITSYTAGISVQAVPVAGAGQATIAAYNIERFYNTNAADDKYFDPTTNTVLTSEAVDVTAAAYQRRLQKVSLAIRTVLNSPDVVSLEEAENLSVVQDIAQQIAADGGPQYNAYGTDSVNTFTNDGTGISVGFLAKASTVDVKSWGQINADQTFTNASGNLEAVNDRPSQVLKVGIKRGGSTVGEYPLTIVANHLRSLSSIGELSSDVRVKKELQAEMLATAIQGYQANGEHVIAMGDFNAFEFSDGYTDTLGTVTGRLSPAGTSVQPGAQIVSPAATDMALTLPANERQSYNEDGEAQILDHIVVTSDLVGSSSLQYAHLDADFPLTAYNDATTPARTSDHDAAELYLTLPAVTDSVTVPNQTWVVGAATSTLTATVSFSGPVPTGAVALLVDDTNPQNMVCTLSYVQTLNCTLDYPTASLSNGTHTITVAQLGDANYATVLGTGTLTPGSSKTVIQITVPTVTAAAGAASTNLSFSATFTNGVIPNGLAVLLIDNAEPMNAGCSLTSYASTVCSATMPTGALTPGSHAITAVVKGDANYQTSYGYGVLSVTP